MDAILCKDGVYVYVDTFRDSIDEDKIESSDNLIFCDNRDDIYLYGGRVHVYIWGVDSLSIDGIGISTFTLEGKKVRLDIEQVVAFLNQIEQLGVDTFLVNYKLSLEKTKEELALLCNKLENELSVHEDEDKAKFLTRLREVIAAIIFTLFPLMINMNAGLDNHVYVDAYNEIVNECVKE